MSRASFVDPETIIDDVRFGRYVMLVDDDEESGADVLIAGDFVLPDVVTFMRTVVGGMMYLGIDYETSFRLAIPLQYSFNCSEHNSMKATLVDAVDGITSGISANDISHTVSVILNQNSTVADIKMPGHVLPVVAHPDGLMGKRGYTECAVSLAQMAGLRASALGSKLLNSAGDVASRSEVIDFAGKYGLRVGMLGEIFLYFKEKFRI